MSMNFLELWAKVESQPKNELYTRYKPSKQDDPVILRHVITVAHVCFALRFQAKIEKLYKQNNTTMSDLDYTTALVLALAVSIFYKEVDKVMTHEDVEMPYKEIEKIVSDPFLFYTLPPNESIKRINQFMGFVNAHGFNKALESYNQLQAMLSAALPNGRAKNTGDDTKKKSPTKK